MGSEMCIRDRLGALMIPVFGYVAYTNFAVAPTEEEVVKATDVPGPNAVEEVGKEVKPAPEETTADEAGTDGPERPGEQVVPEVKPEPVPEPEPEGTADPGPQVTIDSDVSVFFVDSSGRRADHQNLIAGTYTVFAVYDAGKPDEHTEIKKITVDSGDAVAVKCVGSARRCKVTP